MDLQPFEEKPFTNMTTGMVRFINGQKYLEVCSKKQWQPFYPQCNPFNSCYNNSVAGLVGHWRMDEQTGNEVADGTMARPVARYLNCPSSPAVATLIPVVSSQFPTPPS